MNLRAVLALLCSLSGLPLLALAADTPAPPPSLAKPGTTGPEAPRQIEIPGIKLTHGPATVKLGTVGEIKLPDGFAFVGPDSLDKYYAMIQNNRSGKELGVVLSPDDWELHFDYDDVG